MTRRDFGRTLAGGAALAAGASSRAGQPAAARRPNVLFLLSDQHTHGYVGFAGHPLVATPNLDRIAARGTMFRSAYCNSPVCVPSRSALATGMYASDCNSFCNATVWDGSHPTWASRLRAAGYECFATGKMDLNPDFKTGFNEVETGHGHWRNPDLTAFFRRPLCMRIDTRRQIEGKSRPEPAARDAAAVQHTLDFIRAQPRDGRPWAAYCGLLQPHPPFVGWDRILARYDPAKMALPDVTPEDLERLHPVYQQMRHFNNIAIPFSADTIRRARAAYLAMITEVDEYAGKLWSALEESGQLENTIFVYSSDHGECLGEHGLWSKNNLLDMSARVPLVVSGPGIPVGRKVDTPVSHVDLIRTFLEWGGAEAPATLRGHSLTPLLHGRRDGHRGWAYCESHCEGNCTGTFMIREGDWKLIHLSWYEGLLFNLAEDPGEKRNRYGDPAARSVRDRLIGILRNHVDPEAITERAFQVQAARMKQFIAGRSDAELVAAFRGRLGEGQAVALLGAHFGRPLQLTRTARL